MEYEIACIDGDGIGPSIMLEARKVLDTIGQVFGHTFHYKMCPGGVSAWRENGDSFPPETADACKRADASLCGGIGKDPAAHSAVPGTKADTVRKMRSMLELQSNVRPIQVLPALYGKSPLKSSVLEQGLDIVVFRDLTGGMVASTHYEGVGPNGREASDLEFYNEEMIRSTVAAAFEFSRLRRKKLCHIDKSIALYNSRLWRAVANEIAKDYPDVELTHLYVDDAAHWITRKPWDFDVIVGNNTYGDIISDQISGLTGVPGILAAANMLKNGKYLYERNTFSDVSEDLVGKDIYDPIGMIAAVSMMLRYSLFLKEEADLVDKGIASVLEAGYATADLASTQSILVGTRQMGDLIAAQITDYKKRV